MGIIVEYRKLPKTEPMYRLLIYSNDIHDIKAGAISVNKRIASELIKLKPSRRTMLLERQFVKVLECLPEQSTIKDIDVLFNPAYKVDVMKLLTSAYKKNKFSLVWSGSYSDGKLIYSEEGYPDYRVYEIKDYDILCVI